jgi:hypothetical protein
MKFINFKLNKFILLFINFYILVISILIENNHHHKYKIVAISFASDNFVKQLKINRLTAIKIGKADEYFYYKPDDIDLDFKKKNEDILSRKRGYGYYLWKPYIILKALREKLNVGDFLVYTDAGIFYLDKVEKLIQFMISNNEDIWAERTIFLEKQFSKRDAFILLDADSPIYTNTLQYISGMQIYKKSNISEIFLEKLLNYSQDKRIITDDPNTLGFPNYDGFIENRHDQTVLSLLIKKFRLSNSNKNKTKVYDLNKTEYNSPDIFCVFRRDKFNSYYELRNKCVEKYNFFTVS